MAGQPEKILTEKSAPFSWRRIWLALIFLAVALAGLLAGLMAYAKNYEGRVWPGVHLAEVPLGGMDRAELKSYLEKMSDKLINEGLRFRYEVDGSQEVVVISPFLVSNGNSSELIQFDIEAEVERLINFRRQGNLLQRGLSGARTRWRRPQLSLQYIFFAEDKILEVLRAKLQAFESPARNAAITVESVSPLIFQISSSSPGLVFRYDRALAAVHQQWSRLQTADIWLEKQAQEPQIEQADVENIIHRLPAVFAGGNLQLTHTDPHTKLTYNWWLTVDRLKDWLEPQKTADGFVFGLAPGAVEDYLQKEAAAKINLEAREAKFRLADGRAVEFQGSRPGIKLDTRRTYEAVNGAFVERTLHDEGLTKIVPLAVEKTEPNVKTGDVNDLGIAELLGTGVSSYAGSPKNRVLNIKNAVKKLNGILLKPGEEFSALKFLRPFTAEGGYLPELVIKGDEIIPEIGGGLCQIGTTLFRMAMNAGMKITVRRNHSLVVNYYNDPQNGNPGTDATIYDPAPDFRFVNDTRNYILIQAEMDTASQQLFFSIWGTSDGREGYYSPPQVSRWLKPGEKKIIETTKLKPGETQCQHAYTGADAFFTYTRKLANGQKEETLYESHYRALPEICLVGVAELPAAESATSTPDMDDGNPVAEG